MTWTGYQLRWDSQLANKQILAMLEYGWNNGGENSLLAVVPGLHKIGWQFVFACPRQGELADWLQQNSIEHINWNVLDRHGVRKSQAEIRDEVSNLLQHLRPAIVHCNSLSTGRLVGPVAAELKVPSIGFLRDILKLSRQAIADLNRLDAMVAVSHATRDFHVSQGLTPEKAQVVYNGVDLVRFSPRPATGFLTRELGVEDDAQFVLCIGQIGLRKGTDTVIQSFLQLCRQFKRLHLLLIGMRHSQKQESIEFEKDCHALVAESQFSRRVHWLGRRDDVHTIFNEARLLLHGARQEPLGRVLLEAAASACPLVATDVGGTAEIVGDCHPDSTLCAVNSPDQMTRLASTILANEEIRQSIGSCLRRNAETKFVDDRCVKSLDAIYGRLLDGMSIDR